MTHVIIYSIERENFTQMVTKDLQLMQKLIKI